MSPARGRSLSARRLQQRDIRAHLALDRVVRGEAFAMALLAEIEIAAFMQADSGAVIANRQNFPMERRNPIP